MKVKPTSRRSTLVVTTDGAGIASHAGSAALTDWPTGWVGRRRYRRGWCPPDAAVQPTIRVGCCAT